MRASIRPGTGHFGDVEYVTTGWVDWWNNRRLHGTLVMITPNEAEQAHYAALIPQEQPRMRAAQNLGRFTKGTYLAAHHAHIRSRRVVAKAIGATRHDLLIAYWHVVHDGVDYAELASDRAHRRRSPEHRIRKLVHELEKPGQTVTLGPAA